MVVTADQQGMGHHAALFAKSHGLTYVPTKDSSKFNEIYQLGVYCEEDYKSLMNRRSGKVLLHWCGNDAFMYQDRMKREKWGGFKPWPSFISHVAQSERQVEVLKQFGIEAKVLRRFNDKRENYPLTDLPKKFSVLIFTPIDRDDDLYFDQLLKIIKAAPDISFTLFGFSKYSSLKKSLAFDEFHELFEKRSNTKIVYPISLLDKPDAYRQVLKSSSCLLRLKKTEGFSQMIMQMLLLGRPVVSNIEQEHVNTFNPSDIDGISEFLLKLKNDRFLDIVASEFYHKRSDINQFDFLK